MINDSKHIQAIIFSLIPTDWLCLRVAQMPRSRDLLIFVGRQIPLSLHMCVV